MIILPNHISNSKPKIFQILFIKMEVEHYAKQQSLLFRLETPKHKVLFTKSSYCQRILGSKEGLLTYRRKRTTSFSISNCTEK